MERFPGKPAKAVFIGGFHLIDTPYLDTMGVNPDEIHFIAKKLVSLGCHRVIIGHCTERKAVPILNTEPGGRMEILYSAIPPKYEIWNEYQSENQGYRNLGSAFAR
ncbi:MAG: hypothetical protein MUE45_04915 [Methanoregulaceae archaeon]|jgi:metal-dependent hydrolase (beta-lactamase superfamily II)|nr:hypothetical protein [Methanoregulaceae archaeon]